MKRKKLIVGILFIIVLIVSGTLFYMNRFQSTTDPFGLINNHVPIKIDTVEDKGSEVSTNNKSFASRNFLVTFTVLEDFKNISIESEAYDKNGKALGDVSRFFGFSPCNIIVNEDKEYKMDSVKEAMVTYTNNATSDFELGRLACTVYNTTGGYGNYTLIGKFDFMCN